MERIEKKSDQKMWMGKLLFPLQRAVQLKINKQKTLRGGENTQGIDKRRIKRQNTWIESKG